MMDKMRAASKSWVAAILIGFLILSFAIWGINDIFKTNSATAIAVVGDAELDYRTFDQEFTNKVRQQADATGARTTVQEARAAGYDRVVLNDMIKDMALLGEAKRLGIGASDAMVRTALLQIPGLAQPGGGIDPAIFRQFLQQIQMTEPQLVQLLRENLMRDQLARTAMVGAPAPRGMAIALAAYASERRSIEYVVFPADKAGEIATPDDATLQAYMEANPAAYTTPELRTVTALIIDAADVAAKLDVTDADIASEYEVRKKSYETLETRELQQISYPKKEDAEAARKSLDEGKTFDDLAAARELKPEDLNLGMIVKGDAAVPAAAFDVAEGAVSQPLETPFGWVLIKVVKIVPGSVKPLDEVKDELKKTIALDRALIQISDSTSAIEDALAAADALESVPGLLGDKLPAKVVTFAPMSAAGNGADGKPVAGVPDGDQYRSEVFAAEPGDTGQFSETPKHIFYVSRVDQVAPPALEKIADHREAVLATWMVVEQAKKLSALAAAAEERANAANSDLEAVAKELGLEAKTTGAIARDEAVDGLSSSLVTALFSTPRGKWTSGGASEAPLIVLARVKEITTAAAEDPQAAERDARTTVTRDIADEMAAAYQDAILKASKVKIDEALFEQLRAPR
jgi:peptidyl-prolyl cis-trans isomerase D